MDDLENNDNRVDKKKTQIVFNIIVYIFAIIGFVLVAGYFAIRFGWTNEKGTIDRQEESFLNGSQNYIPLWANGDEWKTLEKAIKKDEMVIKRAAKDADINPRLIVACLIPEQLRLFHSERELFKKVFAPLQILVNQNQFSWGIMGIKQDTAINIEQHLTNKLSPFYLGNTYENILKFNTNDIATERFARITNEKDHYYAYLYAGLYLKQFEKQWNDSGFDISNRPEVLCTLYNIGFSNSHPNNNPSSGGADIDINGKNFSFGMIAGQFFNSNILTEIFPIKTI
jgi:hypothetical protein